MENLRPPPAVLIPDPDVYYAILSWSGVKRPDGTPTVFRYACIGAQKVTISPHLKTFVYHCRATNTHDVHEAVTGLRIAGGLRPSQAIFAAISFLKECNESLFFKQIEAFGKHENYPTIDFVRAMDYLRAGEQEHARAAELRRRLEAKRDRGGK